MEFKYLGEFEIIYKNTLRRGTVAQRKTLNEKTGPKNIVRLSL
jgi:hypothetical protein